MHRLITTGIITIAILTNAPESYLKEIIGAEQTSTNAHVIEFKDIPLQQ